jgi:hypothetical protein
VSSAAGPSGYRQRSNCAPATRDNDSPLAPLFVASWLCACRQTDATKPSASRAPSTATATPIVAPSDPFDSWLRADFPVADGFDLPDANGGEIRAIAHGRVASASGEAAS